MANKGSIFHYNLEDIMGTRFGDYSKYIIQDRALPDVRDGLKPVQRRILYAMMVMGNVSSSGYRKSAKTVGNVIANYHPHGDTSVYDAIVRMSQSWKQSVPLIDMQGNNGSIDDDPPAAMRYTEARLAKISDLLLQDINKNTVEMALNFDDTELEPTVLPARFPNVLINGAKGIAAGYATNIPPHNFNEVIEGTIYRIKHPKCSLEEMMEIIKGPDFPTGGIIRGLDGIKEAFKTGSGTIQIVSKTELVKKKGMTILVISEIPFEVIKSEMVKNIDRIRVNHEIDGIIEVRDETDRSGLRIVVEMKNEANHEAIINYLMKKTELSVRYSYNTVAICDRKPLQLGLLDILDYYIAHQIDVITRRSQFDLERSKARMHIIDGLILAKNNIEEVVRIIQHSNDKASSKANLMARFKLSDKQAEAIVMLHLYRLSSTEVITFEEERRSLADLVAKLELILSDPKALKQVLIDELKDISKTYVIPRHSVIENEMVEFNVEKQPILKEDCYFTITRDGYAKKSSVKSYLASEDSLPGCKMGDIIIASGKATTTDIVLAFTDRANFLYIPVHEMLDGKWKKEGKHISHLIAVNGDEKIIAAYLISDFKEGVYINLCSKKGSIKRVNLKEFILQRYSRPVKCMALKDDNDALIGATYSTGDAYLELVSSYGHLIRYHESEVAVLGYRAGGVKAMKLAKGEQVVAMITVNHGNKLNIVALSEKGACKIFNSSAINATSRLTKPTELYKYYKSEPQTIVSLQFFNPESTYYVLSSINGARKIEFDSTKATPIGKSLKSTITTERGETYLCLSDMYLACIDEKTPVFIPEVTKKDDNDGGDNNPPSSNESNDEPEQHQSSIFDLIDDL